jgi:hypothetical protein
MTVRLTVELDDPDDPTLADTTSRRRAPRRVIELVDPTYYDVTKLRNLLHPDETERRRAEFRRNFVRTDLRDQAPHDGRTRGLPFDVPFGAGNQASDAPANGQAPSTAPEPAPSKPTRHRTIWQPELTDHARETLWLQHMRPLLLDTQPPAEHNDTGTRLRTPFDTGMRWDPETGVVAYRQGKGEIRVRQPVPGRAPDGCLLYERQTSGAVLTDDPNDNRTLRVRFTVELASGRTQATSFQLTTHQAKA